MTFKSQAYYRSNGRPAGSFTGTLRECWSWLGDYAAEHRTVYPAGNGAPENGLIIMRPGDDPPFQVLESRVAARWPGLLEREAEAEADIKRAISQSAGSAWDRTVYLEWDEALKVALVAECDGHTDDGVCLEAWGEDSKGRAWRVCLERSAPPEGFFPA